MAVILLLIVIVSFFVLINIMNKKKKPVPEIIPNLTSDEGLTRLQVYCCGREQIEKGQTKVIPDGEIIFNVKGFNNKGEEVRLSPGKVSWHKSCPVVKYISETGLTNIATCSVKGKLQRDVWVKYQNGVTFTWKLQFTK